MQGFCLLPIAEPCLIPRSTSSVVGYWGPFAVMANSKRKSAAKNKDSREIKAGMMPPMLAFRRTARKFQHSPWISWDTIRREIRRAQYLLVKNKNDKGDKLLVLSM